MDGARIVHALAVLPASQGQADALHDLRVLETEHRIAVEALKLIVACDYRGPQPTEQLIATQALERIS